MDIKVRNVGFAMREVIVTDGSTTINVGLLHGAETSDFANMLRVAAREIDDVATVTRESAEEAIRFLEENGSHPDFTDDAMDTLRGSP